MTANRRSRKGAGASGCGNAAPAGQLPCLCRLYPGDVLPGPVAAIPREGARCCWCCGAVLKQCLKALRDLKGGGEAGGFVSLKESGLHQVAKLFLKTGRRFAFFREICGAADGCIGEYAGPGWPLPGGRVGRMCDSFRRLTRFNRKSGTLPCPLGAARGAFSVGHARVGYAFANHAAAHAAGGRALARW